MLYICTLILISVKSNYIKTIMQSILEQVSCNMSNIINTTITENLIINLIGIDQFTSLMPIFKLINESGGNVIKSRIGNFGRHVCGSILIDGHWDAITRIENHIENLTSNLDIKLIIQRTDLKAKQQTNNNNNNSNTEYMPYKIAINNLDEPGLLEKITEFFVLQEITIQDLSTTSYCSEYGAELVQIDIKVKIPTDIHIPSLREQFDVLCYNENLDASLNPCTVI
jgi:glycine cleavage system transcriptional repressor